MPVKVHKNNNANSEASLQKSRCRGTYFAEFSLLRLSEKGFERRSECGFGRYIGTQTCPIVAASVPLGPCLSPVRVFSDRFMAKLVNGAPLLAQGSSLALEPRRAVLCP